MATTLPRAARCWRGCWRSLRGEAPTGPRRLGKHVGDMVLAVHGTYPCFLGCYWLRSCGGTGVSGRSSRSCKSESARKNYPPCPSKRTSFLPAESLLVAICLSISCPPCIARNVQRSNPWVCRSLCNQVLDCPHASNRTGATIEPLLPAAPLSVPASVANKVLIPMHWFKAWAFGRDISRF